MPHDTLKLTKLKIDETSFEAKHFCYDYLAKLSKQSWFILAKMNSGELEKRKQCK